MLNNDAEVSVTLKSLKPPVKEFCFRTSGTAVNLKRQLSREIGVSSERIKLLQKGKVLPNEAVVVGGDMRYMILVEDEPSPLPQQFWSKLETWVESQGVNNSKDMIKKFKEAYV